MAKLYSISNKDKVAAQNLWKILYLTGFEVMYCGKKLKAKKCLKNHYIKILDLTNSMFKKQEYKALLEGFPKK